MKFTFDGDLIDIFPKYSQIFSERATFNCWNKFMISEIMKILQKDA